MDVICLLNNYENKENNLRDIIDIVKLAGLLLIGIILFKYSFKNFNIYSIETYMTLTISYISMVLIIFLSIYCVWLILHINKTKYKNKIWIKVIENFFFLIAITTSIILSKNSIAQYKCLFIFIIIISTIEIGKNFGIFMATISSVIILVTDLFFFLNEIINQLFENDLIIIGVFILVALPLGYYVEIEKEKLKENNDRLNKLSNEIRKENVQRKKIEQSLLKNQACYNLLIEQAKDAIFVHRNDTIIFANDSAAKLLGVKDKNDLINKSMMNYQSHDKKDAFKSLYDGTSSEFVGNGKLIKDDKEEINVESISTYFTYEGEGTILTIFHDVTYKEEVQKLQCDVQENIKLLNEAREYANMMTEFIANISHELKTPLNLIYSSIQLLEIYENRDLQYAACDSQGEKENKVKYLGIIKQNSLRLIRLINNLLDISKSDAGFLKLDLHNNDIVSVVEDITLSVVPFVESKGINIIFDTDVEEKIIACDSDKLERVILNLISNAIKFTDEGGSIFVDVNDGIDFISISIKDTGVGIPEDKLERIFDRFMQVDKTLRRNHEGTGIGLSIVKYFVEMHNGKIEVKSKCYEGTEFIIKLPNVQCDDYEQGSNKSFGNINAIYTELSDL